MLKYVLAAGICAFLIVSLLRGGFWGRLLAGPSNLKFEELDTLLQDSESVERNGLSAPLGDFSVQLRDEIGSIKYHRSTRGSLRESLDICVPGTAGMILLFTAGHLIEFRRIGGRTHQQPQLTQRERTSVNDLLQRVRTLTA